MKNSKSCHFRFLQGRRIIWCGVITLLALLPVPAISREQGGTPAVTALVSAQARDNAPESSNKTDKTSQEKNIEKKWGIEISGVRLSSAGYMLDFRFKVLDPEKAGPLLDRAVKPYLMDEATKAKYQVPTTPKVGSLRQTTRRPETGKVYFMFFANPGKSIQAGSKVAVVIGKFRANNLVVQ